MTCSLNVKSKFKSLLYIKDAHYMYMQNNQVQHSANPLQLFAPVLRHESDVVVCWYGL